MSNNSLPIDVNERIEFIHREMTRLASIIDMPEYKLPPIESRYTQDPRFIVCKQHGTEFVFFDHGSYSVQFETTDKNVLMYGIFRVLIIGRTLKNAIENKVPGVDFRREAFKQRQELFAMLDVEYSRMYEEEEREALAKNPFKDQ